MILKCSHDQYNNGFIFMLLCNFYKGIIYFDIYIRGIIKFENIQFCIMRINCSCTDLKI